MENEELVLITPTTPENKKKAAKAKLIHFS